MEEQNSTTNSDVYHQLRSPPRRRSLPLINEGIAQRKVLLVIKVLLVSTCYTYLSALIFPNSNHFYVCRAESGTAIMP